MKYTKPSWAVQQIIRESGLVEDVCKHGIGHPNHAWLAEHEDEGFEVHGCDGCCNKN